MKSHYALAVMIISAASIIFGCREDVVVGDEATMFEQAAKAQAANQFEEAVAIYQQIATDYPDSPKRDKALFMEAYIKCENLGQKEEALELFRQMLDEYPKSDLADDAKFMMKTIETGKDAISTFEEENGG